MIDHKRITSIKFLVLVLTCMEYEFHGVLGETRCIEREREALLTFKKGLTSDYDFLRSWGNEDTQKECCEWEGVVCSNTTGNVIALILNEVLYLGGKISSSLTELHHLEELDLTYNYFEGYRIPEFIGSMKNLQHLYLKGCGFSGIVPPKLGNLTNLQTLDLSENHFLWSKDFNWLSHLSSLSRLDLSYSFDLTHDRADWLQPMLNLSSLQEVSLQGCLITDFTLPFGNSSFKSLSTLDLSDNLLTSSTIDSLFNFSTNLFGTNLKELHLEFNKLKKLPPNLGRFPKLEVLDVSFNSLQGTISEANLMSLHNLKLLDLSFNSLTLNISPDWIPPFQLDIIRLASCNMGPRFPTWIETQSNFSWLDLSCNGISDEAPKWLWNLSPRVEYLNLSHNQISGTIPRFALNSIIAIDVTSNSFSGPIPLLHPITKLFHLSQNMFSGSISSLCTFDHQLHNLVFLDLSSNNLVGELPNCWVNMRFLKVVDLANNNLSSEIPRGLGSLRELKTLQLRDNNLFGELPLILKNCRDLRFIDVGGNKLTGNIPTWIGANYVHMTYLSFRRNRFYGNIPLEICNLTRIQVLDLSGNNISGKIPECFDKFTLLVEKNSTTTDAISFVYFQSILYINYGLVQWKGQSFEYKKTLGLLKLIDLSSNRLVGNIPTSFSNLKGLISLNLSRNSLIGNIVQDIDEMEMLEILDLSRNQLSGDIPVGLAQLHYLAVLDLANNNLSGKIPSSTQLQSFNLSVYDGNSELCGLPLKLCPSISNQGELGDIDEKVDNDFMSLSFWQEFCMSMILGFIVGFWGVVGSLLLKKSWRRAYFYFLDDISDWFSTTRPRYLTKFRKS